jgi:transposase
MKSQRHRGHQRAVVAVARKLAMIVHAMWRDGSEFGFGQAHRQVRKTSRDSRRVGPTNGE